jgi:hypothetical protein
MAALRIAFACVLSPLLISLALGQRPTATVEVQFAGHSGGFWGRYAVCYGKNRIAGWTSPQMGEAHRIEGIFSGPDTRITGILYAPGCALQTFDLAIADARVYPYAFHCDPLPQTDILGVTGPLDPLHRGHKVFIQAKYVALWAPAFLGYDDGTVTVIPLASESTVDEQGHFRLSVPDFAKDRIASAPNHPAEIRVWARDREDDQVFAKLRLLNGNYKAQPTRLGGIPVDSLGPSQLQFATCFTDPPKRRDEFGFAIRGEVESECSQE